MRNRVVGSLAIAVVMAGLGTAMGPAQRAAAAAPAPFYLALGDSLSQGVQPDKSGADRITNQGYVDDLFATAKTHTPRLRLAKLGCPGETTTSMIKGGVCRYSLGSQLSQATRFMATHHVTLITIDIGANNVDNCIVNGVIDPKCLLAGLNAAKLDLPVIMTTLHAAAPVAHVFAMNYYDPFLAAWLQGPAGHAVAVQSAAQTKFFNGLLDTIYSAIRNVRAVDVASTFLTPDFTIDPRLGVPINVELICAWTYMCAPPPVGPNIHATVPGYAVIAATFAAAIFRTPA